MPGLEAAAEIFGSKKPLKEIFGRYDLPNLGGLRNLTADAIRSLRTGGAAAERDFNAGTEMQRGLQGEQAGVLRGLLSKAQNFDAQALLKNIGNTLFGFIDPNVISRLSAGDVARSRVDRAAAGLNPGAALSTADDLRNSRIYSGRYYDVARNVYGAIPGAFNQVYNAGVNTDELARGYIPELMAGYRNIDLAPLIPAMARSELATRGAGNVRGTALANKEARYGFQQPQNIWDRLGEADKVLWAGLKDAIQMASSVTGMLGGGGGGGLLGGLMGGGGGGGGAGTGAPGGAGGSQPVQRFIPYAAPAAPAMPGGYYNPGYSVNPYGPTSMPSSPGPTYQPDFGGATPFFG